MDVFVRDSQILKKVPLLQKKLFKLLIPKNVDLSIFFSAAHSAIASSKNRGTQFFMLSDCNKFFVMDFFLNCQIFQQKIDKKGFF